MKSLNLNCEFGEIPKGHFVGDPLNARLINGPTLITTTVVRFIFQHVTNTAFF